MAERPGDTYTRRVDVGTAPQPAAGHVGGLLRYWRKVRRVSQLDLALSADVSGRHLSFVETGKAQPSREMVLRLAEALQVPLRERNALLLAAGFAPLYRETGLDAPEMAQARRAVDFILAQQEPYPAIVLDRHWNLLMANAATYRFLSFFPECQLPQPANALRFLFDPKGLRPFVLNWEDVAGPLIHRVHREAAGAPPDSQAAALVEELLGYPGVPRDWRTPALERPTAPLLAVTYRRGDLTLSFFSTITTFGTPQDVTLQELRIECSFPADDVTASVLAQAAS